MMKLTKFLSIQDVKEEFKKIPMQSFDIKKEILVQPLTKNYARVGTVFDYLLCFYLKYLNPQAISHRWVAELSLERFNFNRKIKYGPYIYTLDFCLLVV